MNQIMPAIKKFLAAVVSHPSHGNCRHGFEFRPPFACCKHARHQTASPHSIAPSYPRTRYTKDDSNQWNP